MNKISILMPIKNGIQYLKKSRIYIEENCGLQDEIVIIDDGSSDGTAKFLKDWQRNNDQLIIANNNSAGLVSALNLGLKLATNNWVARFDVDDSYLNNRLERQRDYISKENVAVFSDYRFIDSSGKNFGLVPSPVFPDPTSMSLINSERTAHSSVLFNKEAVLSVGGYRTEDFPAEDLSLWLRLSRVGQLVSVPEELLKYQLGNSVSTNMQLAMKQKTIFLTENIGINEKSVINFLLNWESIFDSYNELSLGTHRKILLMRDFVKIIRSGGNGYKLSQFRLKMIYRLISDKALFFTSLDLDRDRRKRLSLRKSIINLKY